MTSPGCTLAGSPDIEHSFEYGYLSGYQRIVELQRSKEQGMPWCAIADKNAKVSASFLPAREREMTAHSTAPLDRRVARTQRLLRDALHSLIREKEYDEIIVKEILDRADVGRSAFYMHFRDKDDLLASSVRDLLTSVPPAHAQPRANRIESILWFSLPILQHVEQHHNSGGLKVGARGRAVLHGHLQKVLVQLISEQIRKNFAVRKRPFGRIPADLLVQSVASNFILVLDWWVDNRRPMPAQEADSLFRSLALPILLAASS
jgi:AcrR family transcriptional regulator